jgi:hypothetical protein
MFPKILPRLNLHDLICFLLDLHVDERLTFGR